MTVLLIFTLLAIGLVEGLPLVKQGQWKEFVVMSSLLGIAFLLAGAYRLDLPTPVVLLERLLEPAGKAIFK